MKKIGLLSDTHSYWDEKYAAYFEGCDEIWHAGDFGSMEIAEKLIDLKPLRGVCGNCDGYPIRYNFGPTLYFELEGVSVLLTHIGGYPGRYAPEIRQALDRFQPRLFVCGHSHILKVMNDPHYDMMCLNPGAAGLQGWHLERTALRFHIENGAMRDMEVFRLPKQ